MAFNVGTTSKQTFTKLKNLSIQKRMDAVRGPEAATILSMLTPVQFAELFPKYYQQGLPDVGGFREAISRRSRQKQDDINFGLSQGAKSLEEAEQMGTWRRRGAGEEQEATSSSFGSRGVKGSFKAANYVALLKQAGFSEKDAVLMAAVGMQESAGNTRAANDKTSRERSYGLFQININAHDFNSPEMRYAGVKNVEDLYDPVKNAKVAYYLYYKGGGIQHWGGYKDGGYKQYLGAAQAAAGTPAGMGPSTSGSPGAAPDFAQHAMYKGVDNYQGRCGEGTRKFAGHMFGKSYFFDNGLGAGGDAHAGSLSTGNKYFQSSGLYGSGKPIGKDALSQDYLNSLPIGTVVSSQGGSRGGHVQIKIGPNQWASDTIQSGFFHGNSYGNFVVHEPNEAGLAILAKNGVMQPGEMPGTGPTTSVKLAQEEGQPTTVAAQQTVAPVAPAPRQPEIPQEIPDQSTNQAAAGGQTATVSKPEKAKENAAKTFNINREQLIGAIKQTNEFKNTFGSSLASDEMIYDGFFDHEKTKKLMADTQSSFDPNTGTVKIGNYEAFKKSIGMDTSKILTEVPSTVPSHAGGGRERVKHPLHMRHLHKERRGDTALVTDARGKQFTVNPQKETMSVNPQTGIMDIKPVKSSDQMEIEKLMAIIRKQESGSFEGKYDSDLAKKAKPGKRHNTASGAYQFNNKTWQGVLNKELNMPGILKQYPRAVNAPKEVQDQVMRARIEKWRAAGHSDNEIILHHFTGNKEGKLTASAQRGNPTPAQYRAQIASHATEYDKAYSKPEAKTDVASSGPITTQPAPQKTESIAAKLAAPIKSMFDSGSAAAEAVKATPAPQAPKGEISVGPAGMDENWFKQQEAASPQTKTQLPPDRPESPIVMNPAETRPAHMQPTPSLARAMDNARGITNSDYSNLTGTKLGGK
jgi:hypothetical protein